MIEKKCIAMQKCPSEDSWARAVQHGQYLGCPDGSHIAIFDDQERYFTGLIEFLNGVDRQR